MFQLTLHRGGTLETRQNLLPAQHIGMKSIWEKLSCAPVPLGAPVSKKIIKTCMKKSNKNMNGEMKQFYMLMHNLRLNKIIFLKPDSTAYRSSTMK